MSELTWQDQAACTGSNPDLWFPGRNDDNAYARSICRACPVRQECLDHRADRTRNDRYLGRHHTTRTAGDTRTATRRKGHTMTSYLEHHGFRRGRPESSRTDGPPCSVCHGPMLGGQKKRHVTCSPVLACCGAHEDAIPDLMKHHQGHAKAAMERDERFEQRPGYDPGPRVRCICLVCQEAGR